MSSPTTQFATSRRMGIYEPLYHFGMWGDTFKGDSNPNTVPSPIVLVDSTLDNKVRMYNSSIVGLWKLLFFADLCAKIIS